MTFRSLPPSTFQIVSAGLAIFSLLSGVHPLKVYAPDNVSECETAKFIWNGNYSPFIPSLHFKNTSLFHQFKNQTNTTLFWTATIPAGNTLYLQVLDSSNSGPAYSAPFPILSSSNDSCLQPSTATSNAAAPATSNYTGAGGSPSPSPTGQPSDAGAANPSTRTPANTLSTGAIAGIAVACLAAGLLIALCIWLIRRRRKPSSSPRVPIQRQLDSYNYPKPPSSDDGWSVTTPRDPEEELRSQPGGDKTGPSWDASLFVREKTPSLSPSPPMDGPVMTRQAVHPEIPRPLSSYPPLIPTPSPMPMPMSATRESGMWADPSSGTSLSRSSTNPFRARMLALAEAAAANSGTAQAGVNGSNWQ